MKESFGKLPLAFEQNKGQTDPQFKYVARSSAYTVFLKSDETVLRLKGKGDQRSLVSMKLVGANSAELNATTKLAGKVNYLTGNKSEWLTGVPTFSSIEQKNAYNGIDVVYQGDQRQLRYDFVVNPGARPETIEMAFQGTEKLTLDKNGNLVLGVNGSDLIHRKPYIYQEIAGSRTSVDGRFVMKNGNHVGFEVARYDATKPLVIDPTVLIQSFAGGTGDDVINGVAVDGTGVYMVGMSDSPKFKTAFTGGVQTSKNLETDAFVLKVSLTGSGAIWGTYLGGNGNDSANGIAVDATGAVYVAGQTFSTNFPGGILNAGSVDGFVVKLASNGASLIYATGIGGPVNDIIYDIAITSAGVAYVSGYSDSASVNTFTKPAPGTGADAFVASVSATGSLTNLAFIGGIGAEYAWGLTLDSSNNVYVAGETSSDGLATVGGNRPDNGNPAFKDAFVAKYTSALALTSLRYYGTAGVDDVARAVAVDATGAPYIAGAKANQAFIAKFPSNFGTPSWTQTLDSVGPSGAMDIVVDSSGQAYMVGQTAATFTTTTDTVDTTQAIDTTFAGVTEGFIARTKADGSKFNYASYIGGDASDVINSIAIDPVRNVFVGGWSSTTAVATFTPPFPVPATPNPVYQSTNEGGVREGILVGLQFNDVVTKTSLGVETYALTFSWNHREQAIVGGTGALNPQLPADQLLNVTFTNRTEVYGFTAPVLKGTATPATWVTVTQDATPGVIRIAIGKTDLAALQALNEGLNEATFDVYSGATDNKRVTVTVSLWVRPQIVVNAVIPGPPGNCQVPAPPSPYATFFGSSNCFQTLPIVPSPTTVDQTDGGLTGLNTVDGFNSRFPTAWTRADRQFALLFTLANYRIDAVNGYPAVTPVVTINPVSAPTGAPADWLVKDTGYPTTLPAAVTGDTPYGPLPFRINNATRSLPAGTYVADITIVDPTINGTPLPGQQTRPAWNSPRSVRITHLVVDAVERIQLTAVPNILAAGGSSSLFATVANSTGAGDTVLWRIVSGGGTLSSAGPSSSTIYSAPAFVPAGGIVVTIAGRREIEEGRAFNNPGTPIPGVLYPGPEVTVTIAVSAGGTPPPPPALTGSKPGIFRAFNNSWLLDKDGSTTFTLPQDTLYLNWGGVAGEIPVVGRWSNDGKTKTGFYRNGLWVLDFNGNGVFDGPFVDRQVALGGAAGDIPVVGDWNGDGIDDLGVFRGGFLWVLDLNGDGVLDPVTEGGFPFGGIAGDVPVVGDWNGDGKSEVGIFRAGFLWILDSNANKVFDQGVDAVFALGGIAGDVPVVGDWDNNGVSDPGIVRQGFYWLIDSDSSKTWVSGVDREFPFGGISGDRPVVGKW